MMYHCYDWNGNLMKSDLHDLEEAVSEAVSHGYEVCDENGDTVFSQWDGWNSDYPNIENICFSVTDMEQDVQSDY